MIVLRNSGLVSFYEIIVIRPDSGVDPVKELDLEFHELTRVNP
jgi:hypothetical protein